MTRRRRGWREGSIYQRADGRWVGSVSLGYDGHGRRKRRVVYGATKSEVAQALRKLQATADAGALGESGRLTLGEYLTHWLTTTAASRVRPATLKRYRELAGHVADKLGGVRLAALRVQHVETLYAALAKSGLSARTRQAVAQVLNAALKHAVASRLIPFSPAASVAKPRPAHREMQFLTVDQVQRLLAQAHGARHYALLAVACGTGMRIGELLALEWADVDLTAGTVAVRRALASTGRGGTVAVAAPKSKASLRTISLPAFAVDALKAHRAAMLAEGHIGAPVFCNTAGGYLDKSCLLRRIFRPLLQRAGLPPVRFHDLRHSHASQLLSDGRSVLAVSRRLGHASAAFTLSVYGHVMPGDDAKLADSLNRLIG